MNNDIRTYYVVTFTSRRPPLFLLREKRQARRLTPTSLRFGMSSIF